MSVEDGYPHFYIGDSGEIPCLLLILKVVGSNPSIDTPKKEKVKHLTQNSRL